MVLHRFAHWISIAITALVAATLGVRAQGVAQFSSYVTPFPDGDTYHVQVWGDGLAEGLSFGLVEQLASEPRVQVQRKHKHIGSLMKPDAEDDIAAVERQIASETAVVAVVQLGVYDRWALRLPNGRRSAVGSDAWRVEYGRRIDRIMRAFKARGTAVYWVGLPIMRRSDAREDAQIINEVIRERAYLAGIRFVDIYEGSADEEGEYNAYGPDLTGTNRLLRQPDGVTFTAAGNRKMAHFVERELKRDIAQARNERLVQLAGTESEQRKIRPVRATPIAPPRTVSAAKGKGNTVRPAEPAPASTGELKAENGRVELRGGEQRAASLSVEILRPAIPATVVDLLARRATSDRGAQLGDALPRDAGGLPLQMTIMNAGDATSAERRKLPPTQTPYFRVLVNGERMPPKSGRADDIPWPPPDDTGARAPTPGTGPRAAAPEVRRSR